MLRTRVVVGRQRELDLRTARIAQGDLEGLGVACAELGVHLRDLAAVLALAAELCRRGQPLLLATPAINVAARLAEVETFEVVVLGGQLRGASFGGVGPLTMAALKAIRADVAFISPDRLDTFVDAEVADAMATRAAWLVVLADSTKFAAGGSAMLTPWERIDDLVTEAIDPVLADRLAEAGGAGHGRPVKPRSLSGTDRAYCHRLAPALSGGGNGGGRGPTDVWPLPRRN